MKYEEHGNRIEKIYSTDGQVNYRIYSTYEAMRIPRKNWNFSEINFIDELKACFQSIHK